MILKGLQRIPCADSLKMNHLFHMLIAPETFCLYCCIVKQLPFVSHIYNSYSQFWFLCCPCRQSQVSPDVSVVLYGVWRPRGRASGFGFGSGSVALQRQPFSTGPLHLQRQIQTLQDRLAVTLSLLALIFCSSLTLPTYSTQSDLHPTSAACGCALENRAIGVWESIVEAAKIRVS